jgi:hypothetical protein
VNEAQVPYKYTLTLSKLFDIMDQTKQACYKYKQITYKHAPKLLKIQERYTLDKTPKELNKA